MFVKLSTITSVERNQAISLVREAISKHQGWIVDHTFLSNMAATIIFEIPGRGIGGFVETLKNKTIQIKIDSPFPKDTPEDVRVILSLTFIHDEPDMKRDVPHFG